jgi:hypothetical protein
LGLTRRPRQASSWILFDRHSISNSTAREHSDLLSASFSSLPSTYSFRSQSMTVDDYKMWGDLDAPVTGAVSYEQGTASGMK